MAEAPPPPPPPPPPPDAKGVESEPVAPGAFLEPRRDSQSSTGTASSPAATSYERLDAENDQRLRSFKQGESLGRGAYGEVFKAMVAGRFMAVKKIPLDFSLAQKQAEREANVLLQEINTLKRLKHPRIVRYHGCIRMHSEEDPALLIFLEYMPSGSIKAVLQKFGAYGIRLVKKYTRQILEGLDFLHNEKIVHRDVKGANILIDASGNAKLADFGACMQLEVIVAPADSRQQLVDVPLLPYGPRAVIVNDQMEAKARKADLELPPRETTEAEVNQQAAEVAQVLAAQEQSEEAAGKSSGISGKELREMKEQVKELFDWNRAWYPIAPLDYLHSDRPNPVKLLGKRMVLWCSDPEKKTWHAALDSCPHRMAPLSIGDIDSAGRLRCRYHGWCFNSAGNCVKVPMAQNAKDNARMCGMARTSLTSFPVQVKQGLVWIFPYLGPDAEVVSKRSAPCVTPECDDVEWVMTTAPVGYQVSVENTFDPSHAPFLHNGIIKYSPEKAIPMSKFELRDGEISGKRGFVLEHDGYDQGTDGVMATRQFVPPCSNTTVYKYKDRRVETTQLYFVPCGPHETRYIANLGQPVNKKMPEFVTDARDILHVLFFNKIFGSSAYLFQQCCAVCLAVLRFGISLFITGYRFQEQDLLAMRGQERNLHESPLGAWGEQYVLGTASDKGVEAFRKWLYDCGNGGPYFPRASRTLPASDPMLFDRWQRHSKHCPRCKRVMRAFGVMQSTAGRLSVLGLGLAFVLMLMRQFRSSSYWLLLTLLLAALGRWAAAERWGHWTGKTGRTVKSYRFPP
ncbi:Protochlorophyllide-dependent translocon component 52 [Durusdinium trenchii]|uniref:Chloroplastic (ACD1-like protein) (Protein TIC 55-IV) (Translocon at the inner envelope membrane of chloroplasts 55-IV) n=1 Tax=Durusdinium trenchii TaxID=1381693 RepID=A0ABP0QTP3_9DINO